MKEDAQYSETRIKLGNRIRQLREDQNLSQRKFAMMIGMDRTYLIGVEKGRRNISVDNLAAIARGLGIPLSELFVD